MRIDNSGTADDQRSKAPQAIVFFARDFLAGEFVRLHSDFPNHQRVYIVSSKKEERLVREVDLQAAVYCFEDSDRWQGTGLEFDWRAVNDDRYLRMYSRAAISDICGVIVGIAKHIVLKFSVRAYIDEPISGFANWYFSRVFTEAGATSLHFQTSWLPGVMFFTRDAAQHCPVKLSLISEGAALVEKHIQRRDIGEQLPAYVINYSGRTKRFCDAIDSMLKGTFRSIFRRRSPYLNREASPYWHHAKCLLGSLYSRIYTSPHELDLSAKYVLFPIHFEPESVLNYFSDYHRQHEIAEQILDALPTDYYLIVKEHPSQPGALTLAKWKSIVSAKRVIAVRGDVDARDLLDFDVTVISIGSTLALEAAVMGRRVGVLGDVHFSTMPGVIRLLSPGNFLSLIEIPVASRLDQIQWYGSFINDFCFYGSVMKGATDVKALSVAIKRALDLD